MAAENFNPVFLLESIGSLAIVLILLIFYRKRGLTFAVLAVSALSYFLAIALKTILQSFTLGGMEAAYGYSSFPTALYFGAQTAVFEVFGAYLFAYAFRKHIKQKNAEAYGLSLAFWENGVLLGILPLISLIADFLIIANGPASLSSLVSGALQKSSPGLFIGTYQALPVIGYSVLERISSLMVHFAWGFLVVTSVSLGRKRYLACAIPMGFVDSVVPFAGKLGLPLTEAIFFLIGIAALALALLVRKRVSNNVTEERKAEIPASPPD